MRSLLAAALLCLAAVNATEAQPRVIDGDTFELDGQRIRIANIDAPERRAKCDAERRLARVARQRLAELLRTSTIEVIPGDPKSGRLHDRNRRLLAIVMVDGRDVGALLIAEDLARPWRGKREPWCL